LFINLLYQVCNAQSIAVQYKGNEQSMQVFSKNIEQQTNFDNEIEVNNYLQTGINKLRGLGFLAANVDSIVTASTNAITAYIYTGKQYKWVKLNTQNIPSVLLSNIGYNEKKFTDAPVSPTQLAQLCNKVLVYAENNGYPFAQVYLNNIVQTNAGITADVVLQKNNFIKIDTIEILGDAEITESFISNYLGIKKGDVYDESVVKQISRKLRELSFISEEKPWRISFGITKTTLSLYLKNKDANRADILVGLLPNNNALAGKFLLTGDVKLALVNSLRSGENIVLNWQNLQYKSPRLHIESSIPFIFSTLIGVTAKFNYTKNDSSFRNVGGDVGLQYLQSANQHFKLYYQTNNSAIITIDTSYIRTFKALPSNVDLQQQAIGTEWYWNKTDYKLNPSKGYSIILNGIAGIRKIIKNTSIENLRDGSRTFAYLYDSIALRSYKFTATLQTNYYIPTSKRFTTKLAYSGGIVYNKTLFRNELFQIGGYRLLRGFDEASLFVNQYHVAMLEPRYLLAQNSYLFAFADYGIVQSPYIKNSVTQNGFGVGAGISLETKNGLFNFMYALGNNLNGAIQFRNSKIHFGYVNNF
jgi:hypothetical protein